METAIERVDKSSGEIVEVQKTPNELLLDARDAARALEAVISQNDRPPVMFNGKRHLEYPHWQTVGKFYNCTVSTKDEGFVEIDGVKGFKASAIVTNEKTGLVVGNAEAYCMRDERNWKDKPLFQLSSMAQTRAGAKALSNKFRYVAIVAGYEPTPSEEMIENTQPQVSMPKAKSASQPMRVEGSLADEGPSPFSNEPRDAEISFGRPGSSPPPAAVFGEKKKTINEKQLNLLSVKIAQSKIPMEVLRTYCKEHFNVDHRTELTSKQLTELIDWLERYKNLNAHV